MEWEDVSKLIDKPGFYEAFAEWCRQQAEQYDGKHFDPASEGTPPKRRIKVPSICFGCGRKFEDAEVEDPGVPVIVWGICPRCMR